MRTSFEIILKEVTRFLNENLPEHLSYHNTAHTLYVLDRAIHIAKKENVNGHDLQLIKIAALYHDIGFTVSHIEHEKEGCKIARKQLKKHQFSLEDIDIICGMIMATKIPQQPKTLLEQIIADADLEYLATAHFNIVANKLYDELKYYNPKLTIAEWNTIQLEFMKSHKYHTRFCRQYKTFRKQNNIKRLEKRSLN